MIIAVDWDLVHQLKKSFIELHIGIHAQTYKLSPTLIEDGIFLPIYTQQV